MRRLSEETQRKIHRTRKLTTMTTTISYAVPRSKLRREYPMAVFTHDKDLPQPMPPSARQRYARNGRWLLAFAGCEGPKAVSVDEVFFIDPRFDQ